MKRLFREPNQTWDQLSPTFHLIVPHIFLWGSCFCSGIPSAPPPVLLLLRLLRHLLRTTLSHTTLSHTIFHTQLCYTPSFTYNFVTHTQLCLTLSFTHSCVSHHLSHTTLSHAIFHIQLCHTQLCHTPSFTHNFVAHTLLCHTPSFTYNFVTYNFVTHRFCHIHTHTPSFTYNFVTHHLCYAHHLYICLYNFVTGVALGDIHHHFAWQAWHLATSWVAYGWIWWHAWAPLVAGAAALCAAGVALWQRPAGGSQITRPAAIACACCVNSGSYHFCCVLLYQADRCDVICHLVGRGCGMMRLCVLGANARFPTGYDSKGYGLMRLAGHTPRHWPVSSRPCDCRTPRPALHRNAWEAGFLTHNFGTRNSYTHNSFTRNFLTHNSFTPTHNYFTTSTHTTLAHTTVSPS